MSTSNEDTVEAAAAVASTEAEPKHPGIPVAEDGSGAVVHVEAAASEGAGAYPITPSTQMGEGWAVAVAAGQTNVNGRRLIFFEPEGEHAAAAVTAGMSMTGLRATNFSSGQGVAYMHESLYAAAGKRLTYVLNVAARAMTKHALNVHAGHDDYHAVDDTGFFQLFAKDVQHVADLTAIAHRIAELALTPGICAQDGFLTSHAIESIRLPERELIKEYLGDPADMIDTPTAAQQLTFGSQRRRIPEMFDLDYPAMLGPVQNQDSFAQGVAAQRPFYLDHLTELADRALDEYAQLTGRRYERAMGYRLDDAEYVLAGQGSVVSNAEAVADYLRETRGLKVGVLNLVMFRPFPSDLVTKLLLGKRGVAVLERVDQPLAVDPPILREIRAAMSKATENARAAGTPPHAGIADVPANEMPEFYAGGFGFGSRDLQPGDLIAAVDNMIEGGAGRRHFYLGIDFIKQDSGVEAVDSWQQEVLEQYPDVAGLNLQPTEWPSLLPEGSISLRIHSIGGWGAITTGKNLVLTAFELLGLHVKANPKYGSEKKGQPTTFFGTISPEPVRPNAELKRVDVVLSPDPNVFGHSDPLAGLSEGGAFVIQSEMEAGELLASLPPAAQSAIRERNIRVYALDGFRIASEEASDADLRYRMQGAAFMGAFFAVSPLTEREGLDRERLFQGIRTQLAKKFGHLGDRIVEDNLRVIQRGFDETRQVTTAEVLAEVSEAIELVAVGADGAMPPILNVPAAQQGLAHPGRFWDQVCSLCNIGQDPIADPFAAISAMPAGSSAIRDMTNVRFEVPDFIADRCTGCSQCWVQCPDVAIPGLVNTTVQILDTAIATVAEERPVELMREISAELAGEAHRLLGAESFTTFDDTLATAYASVVEALPWDSDRKQALGDEFASVAATLADFPLAKTVPFFDVPERKQEGSGGLVSITINPDACKGCNLCIEVCPEDALVTVRQDEIMNERLRRNWNLWERLPDTDDRFVNVSDIEEGIGVLPSLLLKKGINDSMVGGDGACMGCGEKTSIHLVLSTIEALMQPRVSGFVAKLDGLIGDLESKSRALLASRADLDAAAELADGETVELALDSPHRDELQRLNETRKALEDLRWRYVEGPGGRGRSNLGITNSTGCTSVWGSTFPYNPYPYPWVNHLFQDAPSVAIGVFEGHMRKMADAFIAVRRAKLYLDGAYDPTEHEPFFEAFDWREFSDDEFALCPPILSIGGDGAMFDIGFQNLSRLLASGKPIRVIVLDTQVYSNTGGQACTSGFLGQVSDMAAYGGAQHGKEETRKEIAMIAMAHRGAFVMQTSQALPSHLIGGMLKALQTRRPAIINIYTPCPVEHGLTDDWAAQAARFALESRAFPHLIYDPGAGSSFSECLDLAGNPSPDQVWPSYELVAVGEDGEEQRLDLPLTVADWAATEGRFRRHFRDVAAGTSDESLIPFAEFVEATAEQRAGKIPFIYTIDDDRWIKRLQVSDEIVDLAEDRVLLWSQLRQMAGTEVSDVARRLVTRELEAQFQEQAETLKAEYEQRLAHLKATYPEVIARRLAEGLLSSDGGSALSVVLGAAARSVGGVPPTSSAAPATVVSPRLAPTTGANGASATATAPAAPEEDAITTPTREPTIDSELCTTCDECTNINNQLFAYDDKKQAYIKNTRAGTFKELVMAAERCTALIIHPGAPQDPTEPDLEKWIERAAPFN